MPCLKRSISTAHISENLFVWSPAWDEAQLADSLGNLRGVSMVWRPSACQRVPASDSVEVMRILAGLPRRSSEIKDPLPVVPWKGPRKILAWGSSELIMVSPGRLCTYTFQFISYHVISYLHVCAYVNMSLWSYIYIAICLFISTRVLVCVYIYTHTHIRSCISMYIYHTCTPTLATTRPSEILHSRTASEPLKFCRPHRFRA